MDNSNLRGSTGSMDSFGSIELLDSSDGSLPRSTSGGGGETNDENNINVVVRVRPLNEKEVKEHDRSVISFPGNGQIFLDGLNSVIGGNGLKSKLFTFNVVFEPGANQDDVFNYCGIKRLISMAVEGFNTTCFCYGQTGSGKTHTLTGPQGLFFKKRVDPYGKNHGLVFRSFMHLFRLLQQKDHIHFILKASFFEIYNEKVIDLLNTSRKPLQVRWSKKLRNFFVENLFTVDCEELDDLQAVLEEGMRNRSVGSHNMNSNSSRSHTILTVYITSEQQMSDSGVFITKQGKINFVDLAGSEITKKTRSSGKTLEEANNINKSLMVLGYCIATLGDPRKRTSHIPYRDSKLTKLLSDSLAGSGVTLMIACVSPALSNVSETWNTLRYAARAKRIRTKPIVVMDPREALILSLKREVDALQNENKHLRVTLDISKNQSPFQNLHPGSREELRTPAHLDVAKIAEMDGSELVDLIKHYATENEALRKENAELFTSRDILNRDHEIVCRENEKLLKKLEDVNSACVRSPLITARATFTGRRSLDESNSANQRSTNENKVPIPPTLPDSVQKEMNKKGIGKTFVNAIQNLKRSSGKKRSLNTNNASDKMEDIYMRSTNEAFGNPLRSNSGDSQMNDVTYYRQNDKSLFNPLIQSKLPHISNSAGTSKLHKFFGNPLLPTI